MSEEQIITGWKGAKTYCKRAAIHGIVGAALLGFTGLMADDPAKGMAVMAGIGATVGMLNAIIPPEKGNSHIMARGSSVRRPCSLQKG